jgi:hypothetical protein
MGILDLRFVISDLAPYSFDKTALTFNKRQKIINMQWINDCFYFWGVYQLNMASPKLREGSKNLKMRHYLVLSLNQ